MVHVCIPQQWLRGRDIRIHTEKRMTQAPVETACDRRFDQETRVRPTPVRRGRVYMSLYRKHTQGPEAARPAESDRTGGRPERATATTRRSHPSAGARRWRPRTSRRWPGIADGVAYRCRSRPAVSSTVRRRTISPGESTSGPTTETADVRRRRFGRPNGLSRTHRTHMVTDKPARQSDRIDLDSDHAPTGGEAG